MEDWAGGAAVKLCQMASGSFLWSKRLGLVQERQRRLEEERITAGRLELEANRMSWSMIKG